jgi:hypothetical protein
VGALWVKSSPPACAKTKRRATTEFYRMKNSFSFPKPGKIFNLQFPIANLTSRVTPPTNWKSEIGD